jgi:Family of unknown function (DUF6790)
VRGDLERMYFVTVTLLTFVLPVASILLDHAMSATAVSWFALIGKWFVFWSAGVRLILAGLRQFYQPRFTARDIFGLKSDDALPVVRELGIANFSMGIIGVLALAKPSFVLPAAISAAIFYGIAGGRHALETRRTGNQTIAMASDLLVCLALLAYLGFAVYR